MRLTYLELTGEEIVTAEGVETGDGLGDLSTAALLLAGAECRRAARAQVLRARIVSVLERHGRFWCKHCPGPDFEAEAAEPWGCEDSKVGPVPAGHSIVLAPLEFLDHDEESCWYLLGDEQARTFNFLMEAYHEYKSSGMKVRAGCGASLWPGCGWDRTSK